MSTANTADTTTARHAEPVKVETSETIAAMYSGTPPKVEAPKDEQPPKDENGNGGQEGKKNRFQERISELVEKRREAESKAERAEREMQEMRARLEALQAQPEPAKQEPKPTRDAFSTEDDYIEALTEWKAGQAIAKREQETREAQARRHQEELAAQWKRNQEKAKAEIDDYAEVVGKSEVVLPGHLHQAIIESEIGPHLAYYFAKHPDEAKRFAAMSATTALRQLGKLEDRMMEEPDKKPEPVIEKSKAPPPVTPVKDGRALDPGPAKSFEEYKARRLAERK